MLLNENGIKLPKNTKSAKIITHKDCDGFFSALLLYHQLIRQGVDKDRINIKFVQYGDNDILDKATRKNPTQAILSCDFSAYPTIDLEAEYSSFAKEYDKENNRFIYPTGKASFNYMKKAILDSSFGATFKKLSDYLKRVAPNCLFFTKQKDPSVRRAIENFMKGWQVYLDNGKKDVNKVVMSKVDYTSDHHENSKGDLVPGKSGAIGKTEYRSDTEHIATVSAQNLMNWEDVEIISRIDSAQYKDLQSVLMMPKDLKSGDKKERLGILVAALVNQIIKSNERLAEHLVKISQPSLLNVFINAQKVAKINDDELKILSELKNDSVDWDKVNSLLVNLPKSEQKKILKSRDDNKTIKPVASLETMREKNIKNIAREKQISKSDFKFYGNVALFKATNMRDQPGRYLFAFLEHEGKQPAFVIKDMPGIGMLQVAASPLLSADDKAKIDLEPICLGALDAALEKGLIKKFVYEIIKSKSGGHKTIYNLSEMGIIKNTLLSPNERYQEKYEKDYESRRKALLNKTVKKQLDKGYKKSIDAFADRKSATYNEFIEFMITYIMQEIKSKYGDMQPKSDFKIKMED